MTKAIGISARDKGRVLLDGPRVTLRPMRRADLTARYLGWLNNAKTMRHLESGDFPATPESLRAYYKAMSTSRSDVLLAIIDKGTGCHIGNIKLGPINWGHRFGELGILIGDKKFRGKGYGTEACRALIEYAFDRLNLKTVVLAVFGCHDAGITMYRRLGFRIQGRLKGLYTIAGRSVDKVYMTVTRKTFIRS